MEEIRGFKDPFVRIANWNKFNPRSDVKNSSWFRLNHSFLDHPEFEHFTCQDIGVWIALLSTASIASKSEFRLSAKRIALRARVSETEVWGALVKLRSLGCISVSEGPTLKEESSARGENVTSASRERSTTNERTNVRTYNKKNTCAKTDEHFEALWKKYPEGVKVRAKKAYEKQIKSDADRVNLSKAVDNYLAECEIKKRYLMHFSTFLGSERSGHPWLEWISRQLPAGQANGSRSIPKASSIVDRVLEGIPRFSSGANMSPKEYETHRARIEKALGPEAFALVVKIGGWQKAHALAAQGELTLRAKLFAAAKGEVAA